jgi:hypothetical protein
MHYRSSVLLALLLPAVLTCTTILVPQTTHEMLTQIVGALVFYSFLLLPTALKFDFRRDIDRLGVIKALPIGPAAVTAGQLAVPVLITTLFQLTVLLAAIAIRPFPLASLAMAMIILLPVNVLIFSTENLIFMLYPYRLNQEGLGIFIRSVLTFTAKGILFACGAVAALAWAMVAYQCGSLVLPNNGQRGALILFTVGLWIMTSALALAATWLLIRAYRRFDPSQDAPAMS